MDWMILLARLLLVAVFLVAALGKLADRRASREALAEFGVPHRLRAPVAFLLPLVELMVAALLTQSGRARWGAFAALGLLLLFTSGIAISLARGKKPNCHCFGQLHSAPVGWPTLIRNGFLAIVAGLVFWRDGTNAALDSIFAGAGFSAVTAIAVTAAIVGLSVAALEGWLLFNVVRQQGRFLIRLETVERALGLTPGTGLPIGQPAPEFQLPEVRGDQTTLATLRRSGRPVLLFFTNPDCPPCDAILPDVARWQRAHAGRVTIAAIGRGSIEANRAQAEKHELRTVLLQKEREVFEAYRVGSTPAAVLVSRNGKIDSLIGYGAEGVEDVLRQGLDAAESAIVEPLLSRSNEQSQTAGMTIPAIGQRVPALVLFDLDGESVNLADIRTASTLCLFWNPACGFCQRMLPALKTWERKRSAWSPQLLLVSTGTVEANRAMGLASRIVLDPEGSAMRALGATGTPVAVLLDATGRIASSLAAGEQAVMALARSHHPDTVSLTS